MRSLLLVLLLAVSTVHGFWSGGDDSKFIKKFAMMKVYESCFGDEVVREVREEMRAAAARCASASGIPTPPAPSPAQPSPPHHVEPTERPRPQQQDKNRPSSSLNAENMLRLQALLQNIKAQGAAASASHTPVASAPQQQFPFQPYPRPGGISGGPFNPHPNYFPSQQPFAGYNPYYYPPASPNPYYMAQQPYQQHPYYMQRSSRDMRYGGAGRVRNVTCVMQELGYLDADLEPNYAGIISRIEKLPLPTELRTDMTEAVQFCQRFSQCVPEADPEKPQVSAEFSKPMIFFRCYKQKKLEACVLKDVRERFIHHAAAAGNSADDPELPDHNGLQDEEYSDGPALRYRGRSGRKLKTGPSASDLAEVILGEDALTL